MEHRVFRLSFVFIIYYEGMSDRVLLNLYYANYQTISVLINVTSVVFLFSCCYLSEDPVEPAYGFERGLYF